MLVVHALLATMSCSRSAFLNFCNSSEARQLFIHVSERGGALHVAPSPPKSITEKALFFLKCSHASKLTKETITEDVVYTECSNLPLEHLELLVREVYLPLVAAPGSLPRGVKGDKLLDLLHRLMNSLQVCVCVCVCVCDERYWGGVSIVETSSRINVCIAN